MFGNGVVRKGMGIEPVFCTGLSTGVSGCFRLGEYQDILPIQ